MYQYANMHAIVLQFIGELNAKANMYQHRIAVYTVTHAAEYIGKSKGGWD